MFGIPQCNDFKHCILTIGVGVTYGIHTSNRFAEEIKDKETDDTSKKRHSTCRLCFIWAATTTIAGIGLLVFDLMPPLQQFGRITALTIL